MNAEATETLSLPRLYRAWNDFQRDHARKTRCFSGEATADLVGDDGVYNLAGMTVAGAAAGDADPFDALVYEIRRAWILPAAGGVRQEIYETPYDTLPADLTTATGTPLHYAFRGTSAITLLPTPASDVTGGLIIDGYFLPSDLAEDSSADETDLAFPDSHRDALVYGFAVRMAEIGAEDPTIAGRLPRYEAKYDELVAELAWQENFPGIGPLRMNSRPSYVLNPRLRRGVYPGSYY